MYCSELTMAYEGDCFAIEKCPDPVSPKNAIPVCGSDGVNYPNENAFNCAKFNSTSKNDFSLNMQKHKDLPLSAFSPTKSESKRMFPTGIKQRRSLLAQTDPLLWTNCNSRVRL